MQGDAAAARAGGICDSTKSDPANGATLTCALAYRRRGWLLLPCRRGYKHPLVSRGFHAATTDEAQIRDWCRRWRRALFGVPTGRAGAGVVVLDIDVKRAKVNGFDTLAELWQAILPETPMVCAPSGGLHVYADPGERSIRNTAGSGGRGVGRGLDVRGDCGYVIVPSPGTGYEWDPVYQLDSVPFAPAPDGLVAPTLEQQRAAACPLLPSEGPTDDGQWALSPRGRAHAGRIKD